MTTNCDDTESPERYTRRSDRRAEPGKIVH
jgi:hypothetical protein